MVNTAMLNNYTGTMTEGLFFILDRRHFLLSTISTNPVWIILAAVYWPPGILTVFGVGIHRGGIFRLLFWKSSLWSTPGKRFDLSPSAKTAYRLGPFLRITYPTITAEISTGR
jgi:hypothetical protein